MNEVTLHDAMLRRHTELLAKRKAEESAAVAATSDFAAHLPATPLKETDAAAVTSPIAPARVASKPPAQTAPPPAAANAATVPTLSAHQLDLLAQSMGAPAPAEAKTPAAPLPATQPNYQLSKAMAVSRSVELPHDQVALLTKSLGLDMAAVSAIPTAKTPAAAATGAPSLSDAQMAQFMGRFGKADSTAAPAASSLTTAKQAAPATVKASSATRVAVAAPTGELHFFPIQPGAGRSVTPSANQAYLKAVHTMQRSLTAPGMASGR